MFELSRASCLLGLSACLCLSMTALGAPAASPATAPPAVSEANAPANAMPAEGVAVPEMGAIKGASVSFIEPKNGASVPKTFPLKFRVDGLKVEPAGKVVPGSGHFHLLVDSPIVPEGQVIPVDEKHIHFGKGQTDTKLTLPPGEHTLVLEFADGAHRAYNSMLTKTIKVKVQ